MQDRLESIGIDLYLLETEFEISGMDTSCIATAIMITAIGRNLSF